MGDVLLVHDRDRGEEMPQPVAATDVGQLVQQHRAPLGGRPAHRVGGQHQPGRGEAEGVGDGAVGAQPQTGAGAQPQLALDRRQSETARTLGLSEWQTVRWHLLPALGPAYLSVWALAFAISLTAFGTAHLLADASRPALPALSAATVGIAVQGGAEASLAAADVYLARPGLAPLVRLVRGSRRTLDVIRRNVLVSLLYNVITGGLAMAGLINPLIAAILMPISSLTVVTMSYRSRTFQE